LTTGELADRLGGALTGDAARVIRSVATLELAGPEDLSWYGDPRYRDPLARTRAGVVLVPRDCELPADLCAIRVADPDAALGVVLGLFAPPVDTVPEGVDPLASVATDAVVDGACIGPHVTIREGSRVGAGTQLHAGVYVGHGCRIGRDCVLWPNVVVREYGELGDRVVLHPGVVIGADGFGYRQEAGRHVKIPQIGRVVIEDDVEIGANTCVDRARSGETRIGRGTKIDNLVQIGHNVRVGEDCIIVAQCGLSGSVTLGRHVMLGGQVGVADHAHLHDGVVVAAMSGAKGEMAPGKAYRGIPCEENAVYTRQRVAVRRLPKLLEQFRALAKRVEKLESSADHPD
jgi:UDP-3-O-[3-hydroxymyristoyl] glucosamine N-acyltransferase